MFQSTTATMYPLTVDGFGDETRGTGFTVEIDPVLGRKRIFTNEQEEITGYETVISHNDNIDLSVEQYELVYNGRTYQIEGIEPFYYTGTMNVHHYEVVLR